MGVFTHESHSRCTPLPNMPLGFDDATNIPFASNVEWSCGNSMIKRAEANHLVAFRRDKPEEMPA